LRGFAGSTPTPRVDRHGRLGIRWRGAIIHLRATADARAGGSLRTPARAARALAILLRTLALAWTILARIRTLPPAPWFIALRSVRRSLLALITPTRVLWRWLAPAAARLLVVRRIRHVLRKFARDLLEFLPLLRAHLLEHLFRPLAQVAALPLRLLGVLTGHLPGLLAVAERLGKPLKRIGVGQFLIARLFLWILASLRRILATGLTLGSILWRIRAIGRGARLPALRLVALLAAQRIAHLLLPTLLAHLLRVGLLLGVALLSAVPRLLLITLLRSWRGWLL
jgi:hypothetical protein